MPEQSTSPQPGPSRRNLPPFPCSTDPEGIIIISSESETEDQDDRQMDERQDVIMISSDDESDPPRRQLPQRRARLNAIVKLTRLRKRP